MNRKLPIMLLTMILLFSAWVSAHEIRPAYLEIQQSSAQHMRILWKQPVVGDVALPMQPELSSGWLEGSSSNTVYTDSYLIRRWQLDHSWRELKEQTLTIVGLAGSLTDVLVRIVDINGNENIHMLKPDSPSLSLSATAKPALAVAEYLLLGIEHIWTGIDHLLFVLALLLLASRFSHVLQTITAFTIAHSVTLAAAVLEFVRVPTAPIEAVIALSVMYLAAELIYMRRGRSGFAQRFPWLVAFTFGLLHGFGFAGALNSVGLPADSIPLALLCFNLGIEFGQIIFVSAVLLASYVIARVVPPIGVRVRTVAPHVIGSLAAFWFIERTLLVFF